MDHKYVVVYGYAWILPRGHGDMAINTNIVSCLHAVLYSDIKTVPRR